MRKYGDKLFSANYRGFLGVDGRRRVNSGIRETAEKEPNNFWAYNNGITVLTRSMARRKEGCTDVKGYINNQWRTNIWNNWGRLTRTQDSHYCWFNFCVASSNALIHQRLTRIVRFNNTQNAITNWDRFSNDADQKRLSEEFVELGYAYIKKRGFNAQGDQIGIEQVLQPLIAFHGRPRDAVRGKAQLFLQDALYRDAFQDKKARHILFVYSLARAIDNYRLALKVQSNEGTLITVKGRQLALLRMLNFKPFLIAAISNSLETVVGAQCNPLTVSFKPEAARGTVLAELSARWVPVVEAVLPLLAAVIEPDSFGKRFSGEEDFLTQIKHQLDGMIEASGQGQRYADFRSIVAPT